MKQLLNNFLLKISKDYGFYFGGDQPLVAWSERLRSVFGAFIGLILMITSAKYISELSGIDDWLMASLGTSAFLVFTLPQSPMAQPWAVFAGNTLSALIGIGCFHLISEPLLALPTATVISFGNIYPTLSLSPYSCSSLNCGIGAYCSLPLCHFSSNG